MLAEMDFHAHYIRASENGSNVLKWISPFKRTVILLLLLLCASPVDGAQTPRLHHSTSVTLRTDQTCTVLKSSSANTFWIFISPLQMFPFRIWQDELWYWMFAYSDKRKTLLIPRRVNSTQSEVSVGAIFSVKLQSLDQPVGLSGGI